MPHVGANMCKILEKLKKYRREKKEIDFVLGATIASHINAHPRNQKCNHEHAGYRHCVHA